MKRWVIFNHTGARSERVANPIPTATMSPTEKRLYH